MALATNSAGSSFLYAADGAQNRIDVFNGSFAPQALPKGAVAYAASGVMTNVPPRQAKVTDPTWHNEEFSRRAQNSWPHSYKSRRCAYHQRVT